MNTTNSTTDGGGLKSQSLLHTNFENAAIRRETVKKVNSSTTMGHLKVNADGTITLTEAQLDVSCCIFQSWM